MVKFFFTVNVFLTSSKVRDLVRAFSESITLDRRFSEARRVLFAGGLGTS